MVLFQSHLNYESEPKDKQALCYVQEYTAGSRTRKAFDFNKKLLETYDVTEYPDLFESHSGFHRDYMKSIRYYYSDLGKLDFKRDFLSSDEQRQLLSGSIPHNSVLNHKVIITLWKRHYGMTVSVRSMIKRRSGKF